jgi:metallo-beta-lactamase class B
MQAFDDLYLMGTPSTSSWLLTSDDGYILYCTQRVHDAEDVLIPGIKKLGFDPAKVKYVIVSYALGSCDCERPSFRGMMCSGNRCS